MLNSRSLGTFTILSAAPLTALIAVVAIVCALLPSTWQTSLAWSRVADTTFFSREWLTLWSAHFTHYGWQHAVMNTLVFTIASAMVERRIVTRALGLALLVAAPVILLVLSWVSPEISEYRGLSALSLMSMVLAASMLTVEATSRASKVMALAFVSLLFCKIALDAAAGQSAGSLALGSTPFVVEWRAHLLGAMLGVGLGVMLWRTRARHSAQCGQCCKSLRITNNK